MPNFFLISLLNRASKTERAYRMQAPVSVGGVGEALTGPMKVDFSSKSSSFSNNSDSSWTPKSNLKSALAQTMQWTGLVGVLRIVQIGYCFWVGLGWHS